jgi:tRNA (guanine37-N1)-methyltransferase
MSQTELPDDISIAPVEPDDLAELLVLQRCCWVQEAIVNQTLDIPALHETAEDVADWATTWQVWCLRRQGRLIGAVRGRAEDSVWHIGRLMVAPDQAGRGLGRWLLSYVESKAPGGTSAYSLLTGARSERNIAMYHRAGYQLLDRAPGVVHLTKQPTAVTGVAARPRRSLDQAPGPV